MNVCEALLEILADYGVKQIFGIPGDAVNELIEAIRKQDRIRFIHVMHEESGAFAASAQAKLSGELSVCVGTAGPGAIHLLNGLYDAKMDHAPVLAISGQVSTDIIGTNAHQEINVQALFEDVADYNQVILNPAQMPEIATLACQTALSMNGVVHLSIPVDIAVKEVKDFEQKRQIIKNRSYLMPPEKDIRKAAELIRNAKKPCILAGIGAREATEELKDLASKISAPIIKSLRAKDIMPDDDPLTLGGIGNLGTEASYYAIKNCDLLLIAGSDFPYLQFYPDAGVPCIQIDKNIERIGRRREISLALGGDCRATLEALLPLLKKNSNKDFLKECQQRMKEWREEQDIIELSEENPIPPQALARMISEQCNDDAIICCDTGAVTVWGARNFRLKGSQRFTLSGGLSSMAFAMPAAIGAQLLYPSKQVIALCGDGGFAMLMADFATAVKYRLPIKVFVFNNGKLGLIQMEQEAGSGNPEFQTSLHNPDYAAFAEICGAKGIRVENHEELEAAIQEAFSTPAACIVDVMINPEEITYPPQISAKEAFNFVKAKIKETFSK